MWGPDSYDVVEIFSRMTIHQPSAALTSLATQKTSSPVKITQEALSSMVAGSGSVTDIEGSEDTPCVKNESPVKKEEN